MANPWRLTVAHLALGLALAVSGCTGGAPADTATGAADPATGGGSRDGATGGAGGSPAGGSGAPAPAVPAGWLTLTRAGDGLTCQAAVPGDWTRIVQHAAMVRGAAFAEVFLVHDPAPDAFARWARGHAGERLARLELEGDPLLAEFPEPSSIPDNTQPGTTWVVWRPAGAAGCGLKLALTESAAGELGSQVQQILDTLGRG